VKQVCTVLILLECCVLFTVVNDISILPVLNQPPSWSIGQCTHLMRRSRVQIPDSPILSQHCKWFATTFYASSSVTLALS